MLPSSPKVYYSWRSWGTKSLTSFLLVLTVPTTLPRVLSFFFWTPALSLLCFLLFCNYLFASNSLVNVVTTSFFLPLFSGKIMSRSTFFPGQQHCSQIIETEYDVQVILQSLSIFLLLHSYLLVFYCTLKMYGTLMFLIFQNTSSCSFFRKTYSSNRLSSIFVKHILL